MGAPHLRSCTSITYVEGTDDGMLVFLYYVVVVHNYQPTVGEIGVFAAMIGMWSPTMLVLVVEIYTTNKCQSPCPLSEGQLFRCTGNV